MLSDKYKLIVDYLQLDNVRLFLSFFACLLDICLVTCVLAGISVRRIVTGFYVEKNVNLQ
jgi:hypothetical protein